MKRTETNEGLADRGGEVFSLRALSSAPAQLAAVALVPWVLFILLPLTQVVSSQPAYLFAHNFSTGEWLGLVLAACAACALAFAALAVAFAALGRRVSSRALVSCAGLIALLPLWAAVARIFGAAPWTITLLMAIELALLVVVVAVRSNLGVSVLAVALILATTFTWVDLFQPASASRGLDDVEISWSGNDRDRANVLLYVIDEGSAAAMMDSRGRVREELPNLATLQKSSSTYTRTFATFPFTHIANPAMASGLSTVASMSESQLKRLQSRDSPLLAAMSKKYDIWLYEGVGVSCKTFPCTSTAPGVQGSGAGLLAKDTAALVGNQILPEPLADAFPDTRSSFSHFWPDGTDARPEDLPKSAPWDARASAKRPWFYFLHTMRAHHPWNLGVQGKRIFPGTAGAIPGADLPGLCRRGDYFCTANLAELARVLYANSLRQVDRDFGVAIESLKKSGQWDRTMVIVTADHSNAIRRTTDGRRPPGLSAKAELAWVPLLVKRPGQRKAEFIREPKSLGQVLPSAIAAGGGRVGVGSVSPPLDQQPPTAAAFTPVKPGTNHTRAAAIPLDTLSEAAKPWPESLFRSGDESRYSPALPTKIGTILSPDQSKAWREAPLDRESLFVSKGDSRYGVVQMFTTSRECVSRDGVTGLFVDAASQRVIAGINWETARNRVGASIRGWAFVRRAFGPSSRWRAYCPA